MVDHTDSKVYVYDAVGNYQSGRDFDVATGNNYPRGHSLGWSILLRDGPHVDSKVYVYDADGNYQSGRDFDVATGNSYPFGIAWDGAYFYVVDVDRQ